MSEGIDRWALSVGGNFIDVDIDTTVAVDNGACIDEDGDDSVVGVCAGAGGEFIILGWRWTTHARIVVVYWQ